MESKTLGNTTANGASKNVPDIEFWGDGDTFKLISKASSKKEGWMKSTKAMAIEGVGCVVQVTTQQLNVTSFYAADAYADSKTPSVDDVIKNSVIAEALTFVPGVRIREVKSGGTEVVSRKLVKI